MLTDIDRDYTITTNDNKKNINNMNIISFFCNKISEGIASRNERVSRIYDSIGRMNQDIEIYLQSHPR